MERRRKRRRRAERRFIKTNLNNQINDGCIIPGNIQSNDRVKANLSCSKKDNFPSYIYMHTCMSL
jgi:hypothetical protein